LPKDLSAASESRVSLDILLVDDNEDNQLLIQAYLKKTAHRVDVAQNGEIAVEKFISGKYDLVLMDIQMPVMDGYAATQKIRAWEKENRLAPIPVLALTAHSLKDDEKKSFDAGCTGHLAKPVKKAKLLETIEKYGKS